MLLLLSFIAPAYICTMDHNNNSQQLWNSQPWTPITTHTHKSLETTLRIICKELSDTLRQIQTYSSFIPPDKKNAIDQLLNKWLNKAQSHLNALDQSQDITPARTFVSLYGRQEQSLVESVRSIETMIRESKDPEAALTNLIEQLSLNGQITELIGNLSSND